MEFEKSWKNRNISGIMESWNLIPEFGWKHCISLVQNLLFECILQALKYGIPKNGTLNTSNWPSTFLGQIYFMR